MGIKLMRYAVRKRRPDLRKNTCGFRLGDGQVVVVDLTLGNVDQIKNVVMYGYQVYETQALEGTYTESQYDLLGFDGEEVTAIGLGLKAKPRPELDYLNDIEGL